MGIPVLIIGESGSGKTYSIKNFEPQEVGIYMVEKSRMPFKKKFDNVLKDAKYGDILRSLNKSKLKRYVIDDSQYLMVNEFFDRAKETGYQKYTDIGLNFRNLIHMINHNLADDIIVYFLHHTETSDTGSVKAKTVGKLLDNYLTIEGCFNIVLMCVAEGNEHFFMTQSDGRATAKSPEGMFELKISNDLKAVDTAIREYYELGGLER